MGDIRYFPNQSLCFDLGVLFLVCISIDASRNNQFSRRHVSDDTPAISMLPEFHAIFYITALEIPCACAKFSIDST